MQVKHHYKIDKGLTQSTDRCTVPCWLCCDMLCLVLLSSFANHYKTGCPYILSDLPKPVG